MSRPVTSAVQQAIEENQINSQRARLTVYKSRIYFEAEDLTDNSPNFAHPISETGLFISEAISWSGTKFTTVSIDYNGALYLMVHDSDTPVRPEIAAEPVDADPRCRPGIFGNTVFYYLDGVWRKLVFDEAELIAGNPDCVTSDEVFSNFTQKGGIFPTSGNDAFLCYISEGAVALSLSIDGADAVVCPGRFINPTDVYYETEIEDLYLTQFAGAAELTTGRFFYFSMHDGSIKCIKYSNGMFSDIETSIPSDLSVSRIGNVFAANGNVYMCFRFERNEEFRSGVKYTLFSRSTDGVVFNMDSRVLVSLVDYRFMAAFDGDNELIFSATNKSFNTEPHYLVAGEDAPSLVLDQLSLEGDSVEGWRAALVSGEEQYFDEVLVIDGAVGKLELGIQSSDGDETFISIQGAQSKVRFIKYHDVVINSLKKGFRDGERVMFLQLVPDGTWHTSTMTHPFYMEVQGKQGLYDEAKTLENLYKFTSDAGIKWSLTVDLWPDTGARNARTHEADTSDDVWSVDLKELLVDYPVLGTEDTYEMRLYGWSRAGTQDAVDETDTEANNDTFYGLIEVEDENGVVEIFVTGDGNLESTYGNPPQSYFDDNIRPGSVPVVYNLENPGAGKKIKKVGIRAVNTEDGPTTFLVERVEFPGISAQFTAIDVPDEQPWQEYNFTDSWPMVDSFNLNIDAFNADNGNEVEATFIPEAGAMYAIAVGGQVMFDRGGIRFLQDAEFLAGVPLDEDPFADPTWERSYPPGFPPVPNSAVEITFSDWPYYEPTEITRPDVVLLTRPAGNHYYLMHWDDPRFMTSEYSPHYIPYFYSSGTAPIKVKLYLAGAGPITNIVDGNFQIYVYKFDKEWRDMKYADGLLLESTGGFKVTAAPAGNDFDPDEVVTDFEATLIGGFWDQTVTILNPGPGTRTYIINLYATGSEDSWYITQVFGKWQDLTESIPTANTAPFFFDKEKIITLTSGQDIDLKIGYYYPIGTIGIYRRWTISAYGGEPVSNQVPFPGRFTVPLPLDLGTELLDDGYNFPSYDFDGTLIDHPGRGGHLQTNRKGVPQILFATRPYSAFNFEGTARFHIIGTYAMAGVIGLATDKNNYMVGYVKPGKVGIARVRGAVRTNIEEVDVAEIEEGKLVDVRFWHRDGVFGVEAKRPEDFWPQRGSQLLYVWNGEDDGAIASADDIFHVGTYSAINPPAIRITGFRSKSNVLGIMPLDFDPDTGEPGIDSFPESGRLDIGGKVYSYGGKSSSLAVPRGPFHLLGKGNWLAALNIDRLGYVYESYAAIEFNMFNWFSGAAHADDYQNNIVATSEGYAWLNFNTLWRVWQSSNGVVYSLDRSRWFSSALPSYYSTDAEKVWVTSALLYLTEEVPETIEYHHPSGSFAFLHSEDKVELHGFTAFSGDRDYSIMDLLEIFCGISGTAANPTGDFRVTTVELEDTEEQELQ